MSDDDLSILFTTETHYAPNVFELRALRAVAERAAQEEREACAALCDRLESGKHDDDTPAAGVAWECADAIRARGTKDD